MIEEIKTYDTRKKELITLSIKLYHLNLRININSFFIPL